MATETDPRAIQFSTLADAIEDDLLALDYDSLPTYPVRPSYKDNPAKGFLETHIVQFDPCKDDPNHPTSMPIYQTATFQQESIEKFGPYDYTRSGNPTRTALEQLVASMEGSYAAFAFTTGMAAITTVTHLLQHGDEILCADDIYGGAFRLFTRISVPLHGLKVKFLDLTDIHSVESYLDSFPSVKMIYAETPSNPLMRIIDLRSLSKICKDRNLLLVVDSTMMSPYLMKPLSLGADICIHSATKFLSGHSDTMAGIVCCSTPALSQKVAFLQNAEGTALSPFDSFLLARGIKTLTLRIDRQQLTAMKIAEFLLHHPLVTKLYFAHHFPTPNQYLTNKQRVSEEQSKLHSSQAEGTGSVISFETGSVALSRSICDFTDLFKITVSFGSLSSLIEMPCVLSHASIPKDMRALPDDLVRLSIGIENENDLIADLAQGFKKALGKFQKNKRLSNEQE